MIAFFFFICIFNSFQYLVIALPTENLNCASVKPIFETKRITTKIPSFPVDGNSLAVCKSEYSCCTWDMETSLMGTVKKEYQSLLQHNVQSVQGILASTDIHFRDYVHQMLLKAEKKTLQILNSAFATVPSTFDDSVKTFYTELNGYLNTTIDLDASRTWPESKGGGSENKLIQITNTLFVRIFPLVYQSTLGQRQRDLHPEYRACLQEHINEIKPFSDLTKMFEKDIMKTFEATRVLIASLNFGSQMLNQSNQLILSLPAFTSPQCYESLLRMTYCNHCNGYPGNVKPCAGYCINVMRGCLAQPANEVDSSWSGFYEAVDRLMSMVNRGQSLVCLEDLLRSMHSRILEPLLHFNEQISNIHNKAKVVCGQVRWSNNSTADNNSEKSRSTGGDENFGVVPGVVVSTKLPGNHPVMRIDEEDLNFRSNLLAKKIQQFKESVPKSRGFYSSVADSLCADESFGEKRENAPCWNGQRVAEYTKTVLPIALTSQKYNPELPWTSQSSVDPRMADLLEKLRHMKQLVVNQVAINPESDSLYQINDYGSGSGGYNVGELGGPLTDDEDANSDWQYSGSGDDNHEPPATFHPTYKGINTSVRVKTLPEEEKINLDSKPTTPTGPNGGTNLVPFDFYIMTITWVVILKFIL